MIFLTFLTFQRPEGVPSGRWVLLPDNGTNSDMDVLDPQTLGVMVFGGFMVVSAIGLQPLCEGNLLRRSSGPAAPHAEQKPRPAGREEEEGQGPREEEQSQEQGGAARREALLQNRSLLSLPLHPLLWSPPLAPPQKRRRRLQRWSQLHRWKLLLSPTTPPVPATPPVVEVSQVSSVSSTPPPAAMEEPKTEAPEIQIRTRSSCCVQSSAPSASLHLFIDQNFIQSN